MDNIDEDLKKKIESTKFVYMVAKSGVGKTFSGDYLEAIRGWKHIDGDTPLKQEEYNSEYKDASDQLRSWIKDFKAAQGEEWVDDGGWKAYMKILARLTLEGARDSDTVVLTHATSLCFIRAGLRQYLIDAGAKDVSTVFLHCDFDAHMQAVWKRYNRLADQGGFTIEELFKTWDVPGVVDFDSFVKLQKDWMSDYDEPDESEQPYKIVDVTAKDATTLDKLDEAFGIEKNKSRGDGTYDEMIQKIKAVDEKRDQVWMDSQNDAIEDSETSEAVKEMAKSEPQKLAARRSSLVLGEKLSSSRRLSSISKDDVTRSAASMRRRHSSFITTGKCEE